MRGALSCHVRCSSLPFCPAFRVSAGGIDPESCICREGGVANYVKCIAGFVTVRFSEATVEEPGCLHSSPCQLRQPLHPTLFSLNVVATFIGSGQDLVREKSGLVFHGDEK